MAQLYSVLELFIELWRRAGKASPLQARQDTAMSPGNLCLACYKGQSFEDASMTHANPRYLQSASRKTRSWFAQIPDFHACNLPRRRVLNTPPCLNRGVRGLCGMTVTFYLGLWLLVWAGFPANTLSLVSGHWQSLTTVLCFSDIWKPIPSTRYWCSARLRATHPQGAHLGMDRCTTGAEIFHILPFIFNK